MKKGKKKSSDTPPPSQGPDEEEKNSTDNQVEELFGVHFISDKDFEEHFGTSKRGSDNPSNSTR